MLTLVGRAIPVCLALLLASSAVAQERVRIDPGPFIGTLQKIKESGAIRLGYPEHSVPFAFLADGRPVGYSIDLCNAIVAAVGDALGTTPRVDYRPVGPQDRFSLLVAGDIDLECGSSTNTAERRLQVAFSPVIFVTGTKLLVKRASSVDNLRDLKHKTVVVTAGTTNAAVVEALAERHRLDINFVVSPDRTQSFAILAAGKADAFAQDEALSHAWIAENSGSGGEYRIAGDMLSYEPYGLMFRKGDYELAELVEETFRKIAKSGEIARLYEKWFLGRLPSGVNLALPMSAELAERVEALALLAD